MNVLYLIGNGFDLNTGMRTSSSEIVGSYFRDLQDRNNADVAWEKENPGLELMRESIGFKSSRMWSDFEIALGAFSKDLEVLEDPATAFCDVFDDFRSYFHKWIVAEDEKAKKMPLGDSELSSFGNGAISCMGDRMSKRDYNRLNAHLRSNEGRVHNFVTFNYTSLLDRVVDELKSSDIDLSYHMNSSTRYGRTINPPLHVHGSLDDGDGPLIGVDNERQILSDMVRKSEKVKNRLIKPLVNQRLGSLHDDESLLLINQADVICIYGMSLGETDSTWWAHVAEHILNPNASCLLVISARKENQTPYPETRPNIEDEIKDKFCSVARISDEKQQETLRGNTLISFNTQTFDFAKRVLEK